MFQNVIDRVRSENYASGQLPRLIVMGSEQQKLMDMFLDPKAPLFERIKEQIHLRPWTFTDLAGSGEGSGLGHPSGPSADTMDGLWWSARTLGTVRGKIRPWRISLSLWMIPPGPMRSLL